MKIKKNDLILALLVFVGISILLYPTISNKWNAYRNSKLISQYKKNVSNLSQDKVNEMIQKALKYNQTLGTPKVPDAFSIREGKRDKEYDSLLNMGDGMMGYVEVPSINVNLPLYHYTFDSVLLKGAGHLFGSALPVGGESTHSVVSAHRGLPSEKMFTDLNLVEKGDQFYFHILGKVYAYEVDQILTVEPSDVKSLSIEYKKDYATLVTCTPYGVNTQRLLVRGHRIPYNKNAKVNKKHDIAVSYIFLQIVSAIAGVFAAIVIYYVYRHRFRKER
ncbi:MAG: class C sortase [Kandleria vitulina]|jgi:sortase A|uniref:class C sortase n=1 Tax=Kandleria vitulina TaxID=1630 RepID=UPI002E76D0C0|nr:class C sortase [Kandleria vitulina]MEE0989414.1 class C sortase [Kandleria vitulina]